MLLGLMISAYAALKTSGPTPAEIEAMVAKALAQSINKSAAPKPVLPKLKNRSKVGRNALCPCGSGRKYKRCCLNVGE
jgi:uncharacterized protein YecA (UPF0149 family)